MHCINKLELGLNWTIDSFSGIITRKNLCLSLTLAEAANICLILLTPGFALKMMNAEGVGEVIKPRYP